MTKPGTAAPEVIVGREVLNAGLTLGDLGLYVKLDQLIEQMGEAGEYLSVDEMVEALLGGAVGLIPGATADELRAGIERLVATDFLA
ncbi:hypothetical protein [Streptomyces cyaneofuscatus]|uniref:Uncharacterized protein n=1 Tax=Streptomyces cyaneofuscatus TaxID=66883 RepID=A0ABZ1EX29_9ACTN|nr:hypothetical protein [Streptomyces cyaneofuscatus]WSB08658.1 hypothetical protein OG849_16085 [Streptomyces cyaneofuscatus]WSD47808.1 hypothetical protein OG857_19320 [Streptomyces cyaneofuscatus]